MRQQDLCFQYMLAFNVLQNGHLLDGYLIEFMQALLHGELERYIPLCKSTSIIAGLGNKANSISDFNPSRGA